MSAELKEKHTPSEDLREGAALQWENLQVLYRAVSRVVPRRERQEMLRHVKQNARTSLEATKEQRSRTPTPDDPPRAEERLDRALMIWADEDTEEWAEPDEAA